MNRWLQGLFYGVMFLVFFVSAVSFLDPDFGWHLRVGQDTIEKGNVDVETRLYPILGQEWVNHDWLANVFLYEVYTSSRWGYWFLGEFFALLVTGMFFFSTRYVRKRYARDVSESVFLFISIFLQSAGMILLLGYFGIRPQVFSWLFFLLEFFFLAEYFRVKKLRILFFLPILFLVWANMHGTFVVGLGILCLFLLWVFFEKGSDRRRKISLAGIGLGTALVTLVTPHTWKLWYLVVVEYSQSRYYLTHIQEWIPIYAIPPFQWEEMFFVAFLWAILFLFVFFEWTRCKKLDKQKVFFFFIVGVFFLVSGIQARRNMPLLFFFSYPFLLWMSVRMMPKMRIAQGKNILAGIVSIGLLSVGGISGAYFFTVSENPFENSARYPYGAAQFLNEHEREYGKMRLFNEYNWGGYLNWMTPKRLLFIDGRMPQRPLADGRCFLEEANLFFKEDFSRKQIQKYEVELLLLQKKKDLEYSSAQRWMLKYLFDYDVDQHILPESSLKKYAEEFGKSLFEDDLSILYRVPKMDSP